MEQQIALPQNELMRRKPIGVWFSLALAIVILSAWLGWRLGGIFAVSWHNAYPRVAANLPTEQQRHVEAELSDIRTVALLQVAASLRAFNRAQGKQVPPLDIERLALFGRRAKTDEIKPVIDLHLGLTYVLEATADERDNKTEAAVGYIRAAQPVFQSLGWRDTSEDLLKAVAQSELPSSLRPSGAK